VGLTGHFGWDCAVTFSGIKQKRNGVTDVAQWIFKEGRNALSHAYRERQNSIVDITAFDHWQNIVWANEIVQELAEITMIEKLNIPER